MKNGNLPAMPIKGHCVDASGAFCGEVVMSQGLTKREMFAMAAMQGLCTQNMTFKNRQDLAITSVVIADALLAELEKTK